MEPSAALPVEWPGVTATLSSPPLTLDDYFTAALRPEKGFQNAGRALINLPDGRILDPDGPLGCIRCEPGKWIFFGFQPLEDGLEPDDERDVVSDDEHDVDDGS
jgi:hypothetical protein